MTKSLEGEREHNNETSSLGFLSRVRRVLEGTEELLLSTKQDLWMLRRQIKSQKREKLATTNMKKSGEKRKTIFLIIY